MHIYFINYHKFQESSGIHIHFLANELCQLNIPCTVCLPQDVNSVYKFGEVSYDVITFKKLQKMVAQTPDIFRQEAAIFHAWTPREIVRRLIEPLAEHLGIPYFVHLEDNEEQLFESHLGVKVSQVDNLSWVRRLRMPKSLIHPATYQRFLEGASGVTCIMQALESFVPAGVPRMTFWPSCESDLFSIPSEPSLDIRKKLGISHDAVVITYTGNLHAANRNELQTLYEAVYLLNSSGVDLRLIRCGGTYARMDKRIAELAAPYILELGSLPPIDLLHYISAADILVQPGCPSSFNDYRFPSKLPMFLASGRPVILPASNIGLQLTDIENCLLLRSGTTQELVEKLKVLLGDSEKRYQIGKNGRLFARKNFNWGKSAKALVNFYLAHAV